MIKGKDQIIFNILAYVLVGLFAVACLLPFYLIVTGSLTDESTIVKEGYSFFLTAKNISTEAYKLALKNPQSIIHAYGVTIFVTIIGTVLSIIMTTMTGYVLSRPDFPWRNGVSFFFFFTTLFSGGLVPWYLLCTQYLNFNNHIYSLIIPGLFSVWNMIIAKSFMKGIPFEITEAAKIDGAGDFFIYMRIILPMAKPLVATLTLFIALAYWNEWYKALLYIHTDWKYPLQYLVMQIQKNIQYVQQNAAQAGVVTDGLVPAETTQMATAVVTIGPIVLLYPFLQKYFVQGLTVGSVKG